MPFKHSKFNAFTIYLLIAALGSFATNLIFSMSMVYQIETVKLNPLQLVLVGTSLEVACFVGQIPTGVLADTYSRRLSVVLGYAMMGVGFLLEGLVPTFLVVLGAQLLWGLGATFVSGAEEAWCADELGEENVGNAFIRGAQIGQVAALLSIPLGIWLAIYRLNIPILLGSVLLLLLALILAIWMPEQHFQSTPKTERGSWHALGKTMVDGVKAVKQSQILMVILCITIFAAMSSEGFDRLETDHFIKDFAFPTLWHLDRLVWFGIINAGAILLSLGASELVRRYVKTNNHPLMVRVMFACQFLLIGSLVVFALSGNFYLALISFWLATVGRRAGQPLSMTWITQNSKPRMRATIISMFGQVDAIGQIAGGPAVGYIGTIISLRAALLTTSAILAPTILFFMQALKLSKKVRVYAEESETEQVPTSMSTDPISL